MFGGCQTMKKPCLLGIVVIILDQATKFLIDKFVDYGSSINIVSFLNFFNIVNFSNTGVAFSMFQGRNFLLSIINFLLLLTLSLLLYKNFNKINKILQYAFCLVIGGGLGNLTDRLFRGAVIDFLDFGINSIRWPSFNIADSSVCIAEALIFINILLLIKRRRV
jgi:signal peptidase II